MVRWFPVLLAVCGLALTAQPGFAQSSAVQPPAEVLVNTFNANGISGSTDTAAFRQNATTARSAVRFTVAPGQDYALTSVTLPISYEPYWGAASSRLLRVSIAADVADAPGETLEILSENEAIWPAYSNPLTVATTVYSATHPVMQAGASYWIVVEVTSADPLMTAEFFWHQNTNGKKSLRRYQQWNGAHPGTSWTVGDLNNVDWNSATAFKVEGRVDEDRDGVADLFDFCPGTGLGVSIDAAGGCSAEQFARFVTGAIGPQGPQGFTGATGAPGPQGERGAEGATGPMGPAGPQGERGLDGAIGPVGPAGLRGETGPAGATGPMGPEGPRGPQGDPAPAAPRGSYLLLAPGATAPPGYIKIGTFREERVDQDGRGGNKKFNLTISIWMKQ